MSTVQIAVEALEVHVGSTVSFTDTGAGQDRTFTIVDPLQAKPNEGKLSIASPVGSALLGRRIGDIVEVHAPKGVRRLVIAAIS
jgi:transcription elongation factor GreA